MMSTQYTALIITPGLYQYSISIVLCLNKWSGLLDDQPIELNNMILVKMLKHFINYCSKEKVSCRITKSTTNLIGKSTRSTTLFPMIWSQNPCQLSRNKITENAKTRTGCFCYTRVSQLEDGN
ncbi:LOW QUALITY PROTEIN: hypothetical protein PanWU01x14_158060 [Parasponia andersonii]|uniref:Uncharacterized protein n=1 Tax=Parasponia andersonii TaxID=3476 RepID=A0A2P5CF18_PARAD|nr:LOW QUALITY PROTEIN: hypothetical protein PanWU01x14_158060 [Parasponia andersonii]